MPSPVKPRALEHGSVVAIVAPASPVEESRLHRGCAELRRLGFQPKHSPLVLAQAGYFAGDWASRLGDFTLELSREDSHAIVFARGGFGSGYLLNDIQFEGGRLRDMPSPYDEIRPKILLGYSDATALQTFFWHHLGWVTFYGPMAAAGFDAGADMPGGYDLVSLRRAVTETDGGWTLELHGETLTEGEAEGTLLGGCLTLVESTLGTPWELDTRGALLLLEDRGMKPYQVDRALLHLAQAGKFEGIRGIVLGEFPDCEPPENSSVTVRDMLVRVLDELQVPVVWHAPVGHTPRPMLTLPLGVRARLIASGAGHLEILEPAVTS